MTVVVLAVFATAAGVANARSVLGGVDCDPDLEDCDLFAEVAGAAGEEPLRASEPEPAPAGSPRVCRIFAFEEPVPCVDPNRGWLASDDCYYRQVPDFVSPAGLASEVTPGVEGSWYAKDCPWVSTGSGVVWRPDAEMAAVVPPTPEVLGERARNRLRLPEPRLGASPSLAVPQLVGVPVWLWLEPGSWAAVSATAAVPGAVVTATAVPTSVTWDFGPGGRVVCQGPGTPYVVGVSDPDQASPDCGIVFAGSSEGLPGGEFPVTVTVSWDVGWAGPGGGGVFPGLASTAAAGVVVGESQAVVVGGGR